MSHSIKRTNALSVIKVTYLKNYFQVFQSFINKVFFPLRILSDKRLFHFRQLSLYIWSSKTWPFHVGDNSRPLKPQSVFNVTDTFLRTQSLIESAEIKGGIVAIRLQNLKKLFVKLSSKPKTEKRKQEIRKRAYVIILIHHPPPTPQLFKTVK